MLLGIGQLFYYWAVVVVVLLYDSCCCVVELLSWPILCCWCCSWDIATLLFLRCCFVVICCSWNVVTWDVALEVLLLRCCSFFVVELLYHYLQGVLQRMRVYLTTPLEPPPFPLSMTAIRTTCRSSRTRSVPMPHRTCWTCAEGMRSVCLTPLWPVTWLWAKQPWTPPWQMTKVCRY